MILRTLFAIAFQGRETYTPQVVTARLSWIWTRCTVINGSVNGFDRLAKKDGETRINLAEYYDAVLAAKGIALEPEAPKDGRGREATYRASVHKNGSIVISQSYTKEMGLKPGDEFEIRLGYKHIRLIQLDANKIAMSNRDEK